jgi:oxygen-independent coproporphyrinogen-3 oxidase
LAGLYLHIPFCQQACSYCDFYFSTRLQRIDDFVDAMERRIHQAGQSKWATMQFKTLYFGGGTPSLLSLHHVERLMLAVDRAFDTDFEEITLELNPENSSKEYLEGLASLGVTRLSVGIQSLQPHILTFMHRAHDQAGALQCLEQLVASPFEQWSADLIIANPGQTMDDVAADVTMLADFAPPHISAYVLMLEERTRLEKQVALGRIQMPEGDIVADQMHAAQSILMQQGYTRYEVSSFVKGGEYNRAIHNSRYWDHQPYLGLGPSAHSLWWDGTAENASAMRWHEVKDLRQWMALVHDHVAGDEDCENVGGENVLLEKVVQPAEVEKQFQHDLEHLNAVTLAEERIMMALRTSDGLSTQELVDRYQVSFVEAHYQHIEQWIAHQWAVPGLENHVKFTDSGLDRADALLLDLLTIPLQRNRLDVTESLPRESNKINA